MGYGAWEAGGDQWGASISDDGIIAAMHSAFDEGIDWIDTAETYGHGRSEEVVGQALRGHEQVMVFTKVAPRPRGSGFSPGSIRTAAESSLRRLGREVIDLYQLHWPDPTTPLEETWGAMTSLVDDGLVRMIGVSNFTEELIARCHAIRKVDALQPQLSMLWHERRHLGPFCRVNGIGVIAYGPLAYGLLTGGITLATRFPDDDWRSGKLGLRAYGQLFAPGRIEPNLEVVEALKPIATRLGISLANLAIAWVLHQEGVTGAIVGSRSARHVVENARAAAVELGRGDLEEIEAILERRGEVVGV